MVGSGGFGLWLRKRTSRLMFCAAIRLFHARAAALVRLMIRECPTLMRRGWRIRLPGPSRPPTVFSLFSFMGQFYAPEIDFERESG